jgi:hypothetical protein
VLARAPDVLWRELPGEVILLGPTHELPLAVVGSTAAVWSLLTTPRTLDELASELARTYELDPDDIRSDVAATVDRLVDEGLLVRTGR